MNIVSSRSLHRHQGGFSLALLFLAMIGLLTFSTSRVRADAGLTTIVGYVYYDVNGNGIIDATDLPFVGATITLTSSTGVVSTYTTDAFGYYFLNVPTDTYTIQVTPPAGYVADNAIPDTVVAPILGAKINSATISLPALTTGATYYPENFLITLPVSVNGVAFLDNNKNGVYDSGTDTLGAGVTVTLTEPGPDGILGTPDDVVLTTTTAANGSYSFTNLAPNTPYIVAYDVPSGDTTSTPVSDNVPALAPGSSATYNFGYVVPAPPVQCPGMICGYVYCDYNGNNQYNSCEGLSCQKVFLCSTSGKCIATTRTDCNGYYVFKCVPVGSYCVSVTPCGSCYKLVTANPLCLSVASNQCVCNVDFEYERCSTICGNVCCSQNYGCWGNSGWGGGGWGGGGWGGGWGGGSCLPNVPVKLQDCYGHVVCTTTTDCNGNYTFNCVPRGNYCVVSPQCVRGCQNNYNTCWNVPVGCNEYHSNCNFNYQGCGH